MYVGTKAEIQGEVLGERGNDVAHVGDEVGDRPDPPLEDVSWRRAVTAMLAQGRITFAFTSAALSVVNTSG